MSVGQPTRHRASSSAGQNLLRTTTPLSVSDSLIDSDTGFQPSAATASIFLFAQGSKILCLHHDSLSVERRFEKHRSRVVLLSVDNVSERGAGRLVVSYDEDQTAIVWDLFTGDEIARFASFKPLQVAAWMKNGNIAFGDSEGSVMLFEPSTSEHKASRTIFDPITAVAPAADCATYAVGYQNGSVLIMSLENNFTILHTLTTSRKPSAIVGLAWHASSSKQKSDMLAVQCADGDLRVWSIAKPATADTPKTIRILERGDNVKPGSHWISWSKNGRIIQFSQGETWAWDVRTKHVAYEPIPTIENVRGIANFGPGATLFTVGPNYTVQQYDTSPPALVKSVSHDPKQPASTQSTPKVNSHAIPGAAPPLPLYKSIDPPRNIPTLSTIQRATHEMSSADHARQMRNGMGSPISTTSRTESISSRGSGYRDQRAPSIAPSGTTFSTMSPSLNLRDSTQSPFWPATASVASSGRRSKSSRLRNEVLRSPEGNIIDLFPYTRARLASLPYAPQPASLDQASATPEQLRRQMLEIVFGWHGDIEPMIRDELNRHPVGSMNATLLSKWLGEVNADLMSSFPSDNVSSNDWMLLALSAMNGNGPAGQQMARTFATRLLNQGDIHTAATVLLGVKEFDEAVDIYVSRSYFMEAILLTCLLFPDEWQRQAHLVRRWGEYVVENSQQHLAIRCFTCTGTDTSLPWATPTQSPFQGSQQPPSLPQTLSPPTSPPLEHRPPRMTVKDSSLKLITTFDQAANKPGFRFPGLKTEDRTPTNAPGVTPIAESALSPGGTPSTYLRPALRTRTPAGHNRNRLSSIGETPIDVQPPLLVGERPKPLPTPDNSGSDAEKEVKAAQERNEEPLKMIEDPPLTLSSAKYDPKEESTPQNATPQTAIPGSAQRQNMLSNSDINAINNAQDRSRTRNGSRDRKPTGLHIQMPSLSQVNLNAIATASSGKSPLHQRRKSNASGSFQSTSSASFKEASRYDMLSPPVTGQSWTSSAKSPSVSGRSIDPYISSLDEASFYAKQKKDKTRRHRSRESQGEKKSRSKTRQRDASESRGRTGQRYIRPPKRSPSSPKPMSPEDLDKYRQANTPSIDSVASRDSSPEEGPRPHSHRRKAASKNRSISKFSEQSHKTTVRYESRDGFRERDIDRTTRSRGGSRRQSPSAFLSPIDARGRSKSRGDGSFARSPSSPLPMSSQAALYQYDDDEAEDEKMRIVEQNRQRLRSRQRSSSRKAGERATSRRREPSADRFRMQEAVMPPPILPLAKESPKSSDAERGGSDGNMPRLQRNKSHRSLKKAAAARELEARRESLHLRTVGAVPKSNEIYARPSIGSRSQSDLTGMSASPLGPWRSPDSQYGFSEEEPLPVSPPERTNSAGPYGLPATPRAMRHPRYGSRDEGTPAVPQVPDQFYATGHPIYEPNRSASAPVPEPDMSIPADIPLHPAFQHHLPRSNKKLPPLNNIGRHRRGSSIDKTMISPPMMGSIGETLEGVDETPIIDVPVSSHTPPAVIPELQHLAAPPPPPPPPPPAPFRNDLAHHSMSSGSGVGTINIVMDDMAPNGAMGLIAPVKKNSKENVISPPLPPIPSPSGNSVMSGNSTGSPNEVNGNHRRGRSIDHIGSKFTRMADRMRSTSRGRNAQASREARSPPLTTGQSPYETKLPTSFF